MISRFNVNPDGTLEPAPDGAVVLFSDHEAELATLRAQFGEQIIAARAIAANRLAALEALRTVIESAIPRPAPTPLEQLVTEFVGKLPR